MSNDSSSHKVKRFTSLTKTNTVSISNRMIQIYILTLISVLILSFLSMTCTDDPSISNVQEPSSQESQPTAFVIETDYNNPNSYPKALSNNEIELSIEEFSVYPCDLFSIDETHCALPQTLDAYANKDRTKIKQDATNDRILCFSMSLKNSGAWDVNCTGSPLVIFFYASPTDSFHYEEAIFLGYYNFDGIIPGNPDPEGSNMVSLEFSTDEDTTCLPSFYYDRLSYPNSNPASEGYTVWAFIEMYDVWAAFSGFIVAKSSTHLFANNGGDDPILSNADHSDLVCIETHAPFDVNTDTLLMLFDGETEFDADIVDIPITNSTDYTYFTNKEIYHLISHLTPLYSDTQPTPPTACAKVCKYLPDGDGIEGNGDDKTYWIRVQLSSPFHPNPIPDCFSLRVCRNESCQWPEDASMPCATEAYTSSIVQPSDALPIRAHPPEYTPVCENDPTCVIHTRFDDRTDYQYYQLVLP